MTVNALSLSPDGTTEHLELPPARADYYPSVLAELIGCDPERVDTAYPPDGRLTIWFDLAADPGPLAVNPVATGLAAATIRGTVVVSGLCTAPALDLTPLHPARVVEVLELAQHLRKERAAADQHGQDTA